jgi:hypothetical protein
MRTKGNQVVDVGNPVARLIPIKGLLSVAALGAGFGCSVAPPKADRYCTDFLHFAHSCATWATTGFLICLSIAVAAGFLAAQLSNDKDKPGFFKKNQSTFLFALAVLAGIFAAYLHSRADAASSAAAEVEIAMTNRDGNKMYNMCLAAASRWDASLSKALDAANAAVPNTEASGTAKLAEAQSTAGVSRSHVIDATEKQNLALQTLLDVMETTVPSSKMSKELMLRLTEAKVQLEQVQKSLVDAKSSSNATKTMVEDAQKILKSAEAEQPPGQAKPEPKPAAPHDGGRQ